MSDWFLPVVLQSIIWLGAKCKVSQWNLESDILSQQNTHWLTDCNFSPEDGGDSSSWWVGWDSVELSVDWEDVFRLHQVLRGQGRAGGGGAGEAGGGLPQDWAARESRPLPPPGGQDIPGHPRCRHLILQRRVQASLQENCPVMTVICV